MPDSVPILMSNVLADALVSARMDPADLIQRISGRGGRLGVDAWSVYGSELCAQLGADITLLIDDGRLLAACHSGPLHYEEGGRGATLLVQDQSLPDTVTMTLAGTRLGDVVAQDALPALARTDPIVSEVRLVTERGRVALRFELILQWSNIVQGHAASHD